MHVLSRWHPERTVVAFALILVTLAFVGVASAALPRVTLAPNGQSIVYVLDLGLPHAIREFAPGASGNAAPVATISGPATGLSGANGLAVSSSRVVYTTDTAAQGQGSILEYSPAGGQGNQAPLTTISGPATGLTSPEGITLDSKGDIWVTNEDSNTVEEFAAFASGNAAPIATLAGASTHLSVPVHLAFDAAGHLWVTDFGSAAVTEYPLGAHGNVAPLATIPSNPGFENVTFGIAFDPLGVLHVGGQTSVFSFSPPSLTPSGVLGAGNTRIVFPEGIASDPAGRVYIADDHAIDVLGFNSPATGSAAPAIDIAGSNTQLLQPFDVAVSPPAPLVLTTAAVAPASLGVPYATALSATGGVGPDTWSIVNGSLPPGMGLSNLGAITGTPTGSGSYLVTFQVRDSQVPAHTAARTITITVGVVPGVYAANGADNSVTEYPLTANGNVSPTVTIAGSNTGLNDPSSIVLDSAGKAYVANDAAGTITEYAPGGTGNIKPQTTITGISSPRALALNSSNDLFVSTIDGPIYEYAPGASGATRPIATIGGQHNAEGLAFDNAGNLWVSEQATNTINEYTLGASGSSTLVASLAGPATQLSSPQSLVFDPSGHLTVADAGGGSITIYAPSAVNNTAPVATLSAGLQTPVGVDRGTNLTVFIGDVGSNSIVEYASGAPSPTDTISGSSTGLDDPGSVASTPPLSIVTRALPRARRGSKYLVNLRAAEGTTRYRWAQARGHLPRGLKLKRSGAIEGTPRGRLRTYSFTVKVRDSSRPRQVATRQLKLRLRR
jgi:sugar lactone lactonase YvrE